MSTLVKFIVAIVLQLTTLGQAPHADATTTTRTEVSKYSLQDLNPEYIITREEYLSHTKKTAI